jgi:uncharacterized membrane protein YhaH (DUF805 family)
LLEKGGGMGTFIEKHVTPGGGLKIFSASGRIGRLKFFLSFVAAVVGICILGIINAYIGTTAAGKLIQPYFTAFAMVFANGMLAVLIIERLHDFNRSGWYFFLFYIPFFNIIMFLFLIFKPGTVGANDYGPETMPSSTGYRMLGYGIAAIVALVVLSAVAYFGGGVLFKAVGGEEFKAVIGDDLSDYRDAIQQMNIDAEIKTQFLKDLEDIRISLDEKSNFGFWQWAEISVSIEDLITDGKLDGSEYVSLQAEIERMKKAQGLRSIKEVEQKNAPDKKYDEKGQYDKAISDYNKAIEIDPRNATAYSNRGDAYAYIDQLDKAISDYNKAIEINPRDPRAYNNRGLTYFFKGEYEKAWDDVHKAKSLGGRVHPEFVKDLREASGRQK